MTLLNKIIPKQLKGTHTGATVRKDMSTRHSALVLYNEAKYRLLDINNWYKISGNVGAEFFLTDKNGNDLNVVMPEVGNLIKIKLPAPKNKRGNGYDWVRIEKFESVKDEMKDEEIYGFRVRPVSNPDSANSVNAHFYTSDASSTFLIYRITNIVYAIERGRNEVPNTKTSILNALRNLIIAIPAMLGFANPQWKLLVKGILNGAN
jgi:hypothetical protein